MRDLSAIGNQKDPQAITGDIVHVLATVGIFLLSFITGNRSPLMVRGAIVFYAVGIYVRRRANLGLLGVVEGEQAVAVSVAILSIAFLLIG